MPKRTFLPFPTFDGLDLSYRSGGTERQAAPCTVDLRDQIQDGTELPPLDLELAAEPRSIVPLIAPTEDWNETVGAGVIFSSISSRISRLVPLESSGNFVWAGTVRFDSNEVFRDAQLEPVLFRKREVSGATGIATHKGARLAWGPSIRILFDQFDEPGQHWLRIEWADFGEHPLLKERADLLFALELDTPGEMPILRLNKGIKGLHETLNGPESGDSGRIRNAVGSMIAGQANTQMGMHVATTIVETHREAPEDPPDEVLEKLESWERDMAGFWADRIYPGQGDETPVQFVRDLINPVTRMNVMNLLADAAQRQASLPDTFATLREVKRWGANG